MGTRAVFSPPSRPHGPEQERRESHLRRPRILQPYDAGRVSQTHGVGALSEGGEGEFMLGVREGHRIGIGERASIGLARRLWSAQIGR